MPTRYWHYVYRATYVLMFVVVTPAILLLLGFDIFQRFTPNPGIGEIKWNLFQLCYAGILIHIIVCLNVLKGSLTTWVAAMALVGCAWSTTLAAHMSTLRERAPWTIFHASKVNIVRPVVPSLAAVYADKTWKTKIDDFHSFYEEAEIRRQILLPDLLKTGLTDAESQVAAYMLFVSSLWRYGNTTTPDKVGCVGENEDVRGQVIKRNAALYRDSRIGCCLDYAEILGRVLTDAGISTRKVGFSDHVFNEAKIGDAWYSVDANSNSLINRAWSQVGRDDGMWIYQFAHPSGAMGDSYSPIIAPFQAFMVQRAVMGLPGRVHYPPFLDEVMANAGDSASQ